MDSVLTFINSISENYYESLIISSDEEIIDFSKYDLKVFYNNNYYYELDVNEIHLKRREIIANIRHLYLNAISEIYINLSTKDPEYIGSFVYFNIESAKFKLKTIRNDFYIDSRVSRYNSTIDTNNLILNTLSLYVYKYSNETDLEIDKEILSFIEKERMSKTEVNFYLDFFYERFNAISFIPMSIFNITSQFIKDLEKIKDMVDFVKDEGRTNKIKWIGQKTHIGYIIGNLVGCEYIDSPRGKNGEVNYTELAKLVKQNFDVEITSDTLRKYLNPMDDKHLQSKSIFEKQNFNLPHSKSVS